MKSGRYQRKAKGQRSKGDACSFRYDDSKRGKKTQSSSRAPRPQTQDDGKNLRKGSLPEAAVVLEGDTKKRAVMKESVRIRHVIIAQILFAL